MSETRRSALAQMLHALAAAPLALLPWANGKSRRPVEPETPGSSPGGGATQSPSLADIINGRRPVRMLVGGNRAGKTRACMDEAKLYMRNGSTVTFHSYDGTRVRARASELETIYPADWDGTPGPERLFIKRRMLTRDELQEWKRCAPDSMPSPFHVLKPPSAAWQKAMSDYRWHEMGPPEPPPDENKSSLPKPSGFHWIQRWLDANSHRVKKTT